MTKQALLIFTRNPEPGKVKTRLAATLGAAKAFTIYNQLLEHTISVTNYLPVDKIVFYSNQIVQEDNWNDKYYQKQVQLGSDLGARMSNAFGYAFQNGFDRTVIIGTDCPELNAGIIMNAFAYLNNHDVVIGPAADGGYYLLGMKQHYSQLFENIAWSTETVFDQTIAICKRNNVSYSQLPVLHDVDEEKDLIHLENNKRHDRVC